MAYHLLSPDGSGGADDPAPPSLGVVSYPHYYLLRDAFARTTVATRARNSCNLHRVQITGPGTIDDLVADATAAGYQATARLIRDWTEHGLLDYPERSGAGKGHGSSPALYPATQRMLFLTVLHHRPGNNIASLARIPVAIWLYWGDRFVATRQARRALLRWLADPAGGDGQFRKDALRTSRRRAREAARAVLGQVDSPQATPRARRELLELLTEAGYTGEMDCAGLEHAIRQVFEPGYENIRRVIGHPEAPMMTDAIIDVIKARYKAVTELTAGNVSDEVFLQAREAHLFGYAEYVAQQERLAGASPQGMQQLYAPVTAEKTLNEGCTNFLTALGLELMYPADAHRLRRSRANLRTPGPAQLGLVLPEG